MRIVLFSFLLFVACEPLDFPALPPLPDPDAGTQERLEVSSWPPDGAFGVPPDPELLAVRLDSPRTLALAVDGRSFAFTEKPEDCAKLGFADGFCVRLVPDDLLPEIGTLQLAADRRRVAEMRLGPAEGPPSLAPMECAVFERPFGDLCLDVDDRSARIRGRSRGSARIAVKSAVRDAVFLAPGGSIDVLLPLECGVAREAIAMEIIALDGQTLAFEFTLEREVGLPEIHLVESLPNPRGPEPAQEYVEIFNAGRASLDLGGYRLTDSPISLGDRLPDGAVLPPGARALLVPSDYDPNDPRDPNPPPGALLIRLDASLASSGISNSGEPLYLLDPRGRRVSAMPAQPVPREGECLLARSIRDRRPLPSRFATGPCSPGR